MPRTIVAPVLVALLLSAAPGFTADFYTVRTNKMRLVYYSREHSFIIPHLTRSFQNTLSFYDRVLKYSPSGDVLVYLQDYDDYGYAGATSVPVNYMILGIEPYEYTYETSPTNERINWVINHEMMHIVASDQPAGSDLVYRSVFGGKVFPTDDDPPSMLYSYMTSPRKYAPRWYHEGIAVFMETYMSGGIGRAQNGWDEMVFRTMVRDSSYFYDYVGLESEGTTVDFQIGANSYLYGTRFLSYLGQQYGPEKLLRWYSRGEGSSASFSGQFEDVYGVSIDDEWSRWVTWEQGFQQQNLDSIRRYPLTQGRPLHQGPLGAVSRAHYDPADGILYLGVNSPGTIAHIAALNCRDGSVRTVTEVPTPSLYNVAATAYDPGSHTVFYTTKNSKGWRDLNAVDTRTGDDRVLLKDARIGDLTFNRADSSLWGIQHHNGASRIVRIPRPYAHWQEVLQLRYGVDLYDPDIAPDGSSLVASMMTISGKQQLIRITLDTLLHGGMQYDVLYEFELTAPLNFVHSPDGKYLFGSTYRTGVANVVRYDLNRKTMEWLTNAETGLFRPVPISQDSLIAFEFSSKGFVPVMIANRVLESVSAIEYLGQRIEETHPVVREWKMPPPSPSRINVDSLVISAGEYEGLGALGVNSFYPVIQGYKVYTGVGMRVDLFDPLLMHNLDISALYTPVSTLPMKERFHGMLRYKYWNWDLTASYNRSDFYDLFGPTKTSRRGYSLGLGYTGYLIDDRPATLQYTLRATGYLDLERLPQFQNVATAVDRFATFSANVKYSRQLRSLGAVDYEQGITWSINGYSYFSRYQVNPLFWGTLDLGFPVSDDHSSLWFRTAAGYGVGSYSDPFANFYFGGFGNNWVDNGAERRYREGTSFPGVAINELGGKTFAKGTLEWTLPPLRFRRFGVSGFYCTWARVAVFTSGLLTNPEKEQDQVRAANLGVQVDFKLVLFSNLSSILSFGYARAGVEGRHPSGEFMASLKIL